MAVRLLCHLVAVILCLQPAYAKNIDIPASGTVMPLPKALDNRYVSFDCLLAKACETKSFLDGSGVCALILLQSGKLRFQYYSEVNHCEGSDKNDVRAHYGIASIAKSIVSVLLGDTIARRYGARSRADFVRILDRQVNEFIPELGTNASAGGYAGIRIADLIDMKSGLNWREYGRFADSKKLQAQVRNRLALTVVDFARRYRSGQLGRTFNYSALDAAIAATAAERMLSGSSLVGDPATRLWRAIGAQSKARWSVDASGGAYGPCCFLATAPDMARLGLFVLSRGKDSKGRQVIPRSWFDYSTGGGMRADDAIGPDDRGGFQNCRVGYRAFWWFRPNRDDFTGIGTGGQFLHIYPRQEIVIVQLGEWKDRSQEDRLSCASLNLHDALIAAYRR